MNKIKSYFILFIILMNHFLNIKTDEYDIEYDKKIRSFILADEKNEKRIEKLDTNLKEKVVCVPLGFNCTTTMSLGNNYLRRWAFPFDWMMTSFNGLCELIENNFVDFLNPLYLKPGVFHTKYKIAMVHDFPVTTDETGSHVTVKNYLDYLNKVEERYQRRIKRFDNVCNLAEMIYFFRIKTSHWKHDDDPQNRESVLKLRNILMKKFPQNNWVLVVISPDSDYHHDWKMEKVKNFYISDCGSEIELKQIFEKLGLL